MTVDQESEDSLLGAIVHRANIYQASRSTSSQVCSDCVFVLHRVGDGIRESGNNIFSSIHPSRKTSTLWAEMDCGLFRKHNKRKTTDDGDATPWETCKAFVEDTQLALENGSIPGQRFHYLNVPSPQSTEVWKESYYSEEGFALIKELTNEIDPNNMFRIPRVPPTTCDSSSEHASSQQCQKSTAVQ